MTSTIKNIFTPHLDDLRRSGLSDSMIEQMEIRSLDAASIAKAVYGPDSNNTVPGDGYEIPYFNFDGELTKVKRYRIFDVEKNGPKPRRYFSQVGGGYDIYIPPGFKEIYDKNNYVVITEGEKKAAKAVQEGFPCVAIAGVHMWTDQKKREAECLKVADNNKPKLSPETPISPALANLCKGKRVLVLADSDAEEKPQVKFAMLKLARAIRCQVKTTTINFESVPIPDGSDDKKMGLDDLLLTPEGAKILKKILKKLKDHIHPGWRFKVPYGHGHNQTLHFLLAYPSADEDWLPTWFQEIEREVKGEGFIIMLDVLHGTPCAWHGRTIRIIEQKDGDAQLNDPDFPVIVVNEIQGITDDRRQVNLKLNGEILADPKKWTDLGFTVFKIYNFLQIIKAQKQSGNSFVYATKTKGWLKMPDQKLPHYIYGDDVIAPEGGCELLALSVTKGASIAATGIKQTGEFDEWIKIMSIVFRNPCQAFLAGFAASSPLLTLIDGAEPGIVNLVGDSGRGKTTSLQAISSMTGRPTKPSDPHSYLQSWRSTDNGCEGPLEAKNDSFAVMDEVHQAPEKMNWIATLYMVSNGKGKQRMTSDIQMRPTKAWRTQLLSSGEVSFSAKIRESGGKNMPGGLEFRTVDIYIAETPFWFHVAEESKKQNYGDYSHIVNQYGKSAQSAPGSEAEVIESIEQALIQNHGHFWPKWIRHLQQEDHINELKAVYTTIRQEISELCPGKATPVVKRRIKHIALALTGLGGILEVTGINNQEIFKAAKEWAISHFWTSGLKHTVGSEDDDIFETISSALMRDLGRFYRPEEKPKNTINGHLGWITPEGSAIIPTQNCWQDWTIQLGLDPERAKQVVIKNGWKKTKKRFPGAGKKQSPIAVLVGKGVFASELLSEDPDDKN